jgi:hypothetical protein
MPVTDNAAESDMTPEKKEAAEIEDLLRHYGWKIKDGGVIKQRE